MAIAKTNKYASRASGDTAEVVERPGGGLSVVLVDGQGSGAAAKLLSNSLSSKAVSLLKEGARDGAVARATHDYLHHYRGGQVSATLDIVSVDLVSQTLVFTRNSPLPVLVLEPGGPRRLESSAGPIGPRRHTRPEVVQLPLQLGSAALVVSDGVTGAGGRTGRPLDLLATLAALPPASSAAALADHLLAAALAADDQRPADDMTVVAVAIHGPVEVTGPLVRRLTVSLPLEGLQAARSPL